MYKRTERASFHFGFGDRLYWFEYQDAKYQKAKEALEAKDEAAARSVAVDVAARAAADARRAANAELEAAKRRASDAEAAAAASSVLKQR